MEEEVDRGGSEWMRCRRRMENGQGEGWRRVEEEKNRGRGG